MPLLRRSFTRSVFAVALLVAAPAVALEAFATSELTIITAAGPQKFKVELAVSGPQMEQGLMFRRSLAADAGMLFDFKTPTPVTMWMKNTLIPLDMVFLDTGGRVVDVHERAVPLSLDPIATRVPARYVIELNGGTASRLGIKPGDRVSGAYFERGS